MSKKKLAVPVRKGYPLSCIFCQKALHQKSEHYCSKECEQSYRKSHTEDIPSFLSKWKIRKLKSAKDPLIEIRKKARRITNNLIKSGKIKKGSCVVCGSSEVFAHHEDYSRPGDIIWICEKHHKKYHNGEIGLFKNRLWWNPKRLLPRSMREKYIPQKYRKLIAQFKKRKRK
jgi:hypothetical protein